ncbi:hypothetical protein [Nocardia camponoti]|uniref:Uncharacterized protein n=1 Tax=Nocardia camponoti TaxID=1616106 RepID=A0A917QRD7_9NOCA|nr:hypothetical protein [Nocardia camponoti]GGK64818.1 hypothetical protein GCM10011591_41330 [Nocardia camponoti]
MPDSPDQAPDHAHSSAATAHRLVKARQLAAYIWARGITAAELRGLPDATLRKLARAAKTNPPSTGETWQVVAGLLDEKDAWAERNPTHPAATRPSLDEKILWIKPPITPF